MLRRPYSYNHGADLRPNGGRRGGTASNTMPCLFFACYQRDPRTGFIRIFDTLSQFDLLNQFVTHTGGGLFVCPPGIAKGEFIGERLFDAA